MQQQLLFASRESLLAVLVMQLSRHHTGRANGVSCARLAQQLCIAERLVRTLICHAREQGTAICGTPETGYFVAQTDEELEECCQFLRRRAMHSLHIEARLRRIALPDLLGQLHLKT